jgi:hypothetical protein
MAAAAIRAMFALSDAGYMTEQFEVIATTLALSCPWSTRCCARLPMTSPRSLTSRRSTAR